MYTVETKRVSDAIWWDPFTWGKTHQEQRRVWDMDQKVSPNEFDLLLKDSPNSFTGASKWRVVEGDTYFCQQCGHKFTAEEIKKILNEKESFCPTCDIPIGTPEERKQLMRSL